jgi:hypothetical protein
MRTVLSDTSTDGSASAARARGAPAVSPVDQLTPELVARLQRAAGNASVRRLVRERAARAPRQLARLRTSPQFVTRSDLIGRDRSQELQNIDASLAAYDLVRTGTTDQRETALADLLKKIDAWKATKNTTADDKAWKKTARAKYITELGNEQQQEMNLVVAMKNQEERDRQAAERKKHEAVMDTMITQPIADLTDPKAKARALFAAYMAKFRGKATYTTTTPKNTTVWDMKGGRVACAMISNGLIDLLRRAGVKADLREVGPQNFVTKKLGARFIDPATEGNIRLPGGTFAAEKRFYFNKHWIVQVEGGALYLDATSGIEVDKDATQIIDYKDMVLESHTPRTFSNGTWRLTHVGANTLGDGSYELTPAGS